jgi:hypothetical protein|tara:strand:+ start:374 stop:1162 length:789 start_codon:yes stop_codon:yes gene_type:complete
MSEAFEIAWMLLKSFQPSEGRFLGEGQNQMVYQKEGEPNVTKVGGANTIGDMYLHELLKPQVPIFAGQKPIAQTMPFDNNIESRMGNNAPILSEQTQGNPLDEGPSKHADNVRGRALADALYSHGKQGPLLEGLGLADVKPPNWMEAIPDRGVPTSVITGDSSRRGKAILHDPMFYNPKNKNHDAFLARGTPRKIGTDFTIPDETKESFARKVDELPFDDFTQPVFESEIPMSSAQEDLLQQRVGEQDDRVQSILRHVGVKS